MQKRRWRKRRGEGGDVVKWLRFFPSLYPLLLVTNVRDSPECLKRLIEEGPLLFGSGGTYDERHSWVWWGGRERKERQGGLTALLLLWKELLQTAPTREREKKNGNWMKGGEWRRGDPATTDLYDFGHRARGGPGPNMARQCHVSTSPMRGQQSHFVPVDSAHDLRRKRCLWLGSFFLSFVPCENATRAIVFLPPPPPSLAQALEGRARKGKGREEQRGEEEQRRSGSSKCHGLVGWKWWLNMAFSKISREITKKNFVILPSYEGGRWNGAIKF